MMSYILSANDARSAVRSNPNAVTRRAQRRLEPEVWPAVLPTFGLSPGDMVFTIGSCFARNVEEHLARLGIAVPVTEFSVPSAEWSGRGAGILNKYTPPSIHQDVEWTARVLLRDDILTERDCSTFRYPTRDDLVIDTNLGGNVPVGVDRFLERRREIYRINRKIFEASCVVMTLGHVESWFDRKAGIYIQDAPLDRALFSDQDERFELHILDHSESLAHIRAAMNRIRSINPEIRFLVTTSPIPLGRTFTNDDVITANSYSKSTLRAVAGDLSREFPMCDYFPSYEIASITKTWSIWGANKIHLHDDFVGRIVQ